MSKWYLIIIPLSILLSLWINKSFNSFELTTKYIDIYFDNDTKQLGFRHDGVVVWKETS